MHIFDTPEDEYLPSRSTNRTDYFDDYFPSRKWKRKSKHVSNWLNLLVDMHNTIIIF